MDFHAKSSNFLMWVVNAATKPRTYTPPQAQSHSYSYTKDTVENIITSRKSVPPLQAKWNMNYTMQQTY